MALKFAAVNAGLFEDEAYYWLWSKNLALGYFDHPPLVAFWIRTGTSFFGDTALGIRIASIVSTAVTAAATARLSYLVSGSRIAASLAGLWITVLPLPALMSFLGQPDAPLLMAWALTVWALAELARSGHGQWWLAIGCFAGIALLAKYNTLFLGVGILLWLLSDRRYRPWLLSPWLWAGGLVALLLFLPPLLWNAAHDWTSFAFQFGRYGRQGTQPFSGTAAFWGIQALLLSPLLLLFLGAAWRQRRSLSGSGGLWLLGSTTAPYLVFLVVYSSRADIGFHWLAPVYPALVAAAASGASQLAGKGWLITRGIAGVIPAVVSVGLLADLGSPAPLFGLKNPVVEVTRNWDHFTAEVEALAKAHGASWIATTNYNLVGQLTFYGSGTLPIVQVDERYRYSGFDLPAPEEMSGPALYLVEAGRVQHAVVDHCAGAKDLGKFARRDGPRHRYHVYLCPKLQRLEDQVR